MTISDSRIWPAAPRRATALAACIGSLVLPACFNDIADDISEFSSTAQIPPLEGAIGTTRIPLTEAPAANTPKSHSKLDALTFEPKDLGYGPNQFYYLRHDVAQANAATIGTISSDGSVTDRFVLGDDTDARAFAAEHDVLAPIVHDLLASSGAD